MSGEENAAVVRRFVDEFFNGKDLAVLDELVAPDYVAHVEGLPAQFPAGPEGWRRRVALMIHAFPDGRVTVEDLLAVDDKVVVRYRMRGTHQGEFWGAPSTGKAVTYTGIMIVRLREGRLVEEWSEADLLGLMRQTGVIPLETTATS
jgi:steroid delta-isomerase-like uncharacterized protein